MACDFQPFLRSQNKNPKITIHTSSYQQLLVRKKKKKKGDGTRDKTKPALNRTSSMSRKVLDEHSEAKDEETGTIVYRNQEPIEFLIIDIEFILNTELFGLG